MMCPVCNKKTVVTETRYLDSRRFRRRRCKDCNYVFYTEETECKGFMQKQLDAELMCKRYRRAKCENSKM